MGRFCGWLSLRIVCKKSQYNVADLFDPEVDEYRWERAGSQGSLLWTGETLEQQCTVQTVRYTCATDYDHEYSNLLDARAKKLYEQESGVPL